jgi:hypothetical protein
VELKDNSVELTEEGIALAKMALETNDLWDENDPWARWTWISFGFVVTVMLLMCLTNSVVEYQHYLLSLSCIILYCSIFNLFFQVITNQLFSVFPGKFQTTRILFDSKSFSNWSELDAYRTPAALSISNHELFSFKFQLCS